MAHLDEEWSSERCLELIREVKHRPILWDNREKQQDKMRRRARAWEEVAEAMNTSVESVKHKYAVLMSSFKREKSRVMQSIRGGDPEKLYKSNWFAFKEMSFLIDRQRGVKDSHKVPQVPEEATQESSSSLKEKILEKCIDDSDKSYNHIDKDTKKKLIEIYEPYILESETYPLPTKINFEDEIESLTDFIAIKMKGFSSETRNRVKQAIIEIINKADADAYDGNRSPVASSSRSVPIAPSAPDDFNTSFLLSPSRNEDDDIEILIVKEERSSSDSDAVSD